MERYFPLDEYHGRWARVLEEMKARGFETAVVFGRAGGTMDNAGDVLYLANHYATNAGLDSAIWSARSFAGVILHVDSEPQLHIDEPTPRPKILAIRDVTSHSHPFKGVADALVARKIKGRVALVGTEFIPVKYYQQLTDGTPGIEWVPTDDLVRAVRMYKSSRELDCYRIAGETATISLNKLMEGLLGGKSEQEAAGDASREAIRRGARLQTVGTNHGDTIGWGHRNPFTGYSADTPEVGDMVKGSMTGAFHHGYWLDPGRTAVRGGPNAAQKELLEATSSLVRVLCDMMRPGVPLLDVAAVGDKMTEDFGGASAPFMKSFPFYGHGVGLTFELPRIGSTMSMPGDIVAENMVFGVEAMLAREGVGAAFFEDIIIIGKDRNELLTKTPIHWQ
ncbi:MAG: M24 family metallopeptidase [Reyranellaceae bacterium]